MAFCVCLGNRLMYKFEEDGLVKITDFIPLKCDECNTMIGFYTSISGAYYETFLCGLCYDKKRQETNG